jgi:hypothetical protein
MIHVSSRQSYSSSNEGLELAHIAFFEPRPWIILVDGWRAHEFKCCAHGCKCTVHRFLDTGDARLTRNMCKHVKSCWGPEILAAAVEARDADKVQTKIVRSILQDGSITVAFERKGKGKETYLHWQLTQHETK